MSEQPELEIDNSEVYARHEDEEPPPQLIPGSFADIFLTKIRWRLNRWPDR